MSKVVNFLEKNMHNGNKVSINHITVSGSHS